MKLRALFSLLAAAVVIAGCEKGNYSPLQQDGTTTHVMDAGQVIKGNLIVKFSEAPQTKSVAAALPEIGITNIERLIPDNPKFAERYRESGMDRWYRITFNPEISLSSAYGALKSIEAVETVDFVPVLTEASAPFNDPQLPNQWHYHNTGEKNGYVAGMDINLYKAWEIETGDPDVIVAVLDNGVQYNHDDLARNMWVNTAEKNGTTGLDDDNNGYVDDIYGYNFCAVGNTSAMHGTIQPGDHGTHVAGTVAAVNGNNLFGCGIAGGNGTGQGVRIMTCQTINDTDGSYIALAFTYAAENGAVISQNSWSLTNATSTPAYLIEAIEYFNKYAGMDPSGRNQTGPMAGGITIFAAGNDNRDVGYPAMIDQVLAVAATSPSGKKASYSNYGKWVDIAAPGGEASAYPTGDVYSTITGNSFGQKHGTSMACPHVSGVAALVVSKYGGKGFTNAQLKDILLSSANYDKLYDQNPDYKAKQVSALISTPDKLGAGLVDAYKAVTMLGGGDDDNDDDQQDSNIPDPVETIEVDHTQTTSNSITVKWAATSTDGNPTYGYKLFYSKQSLAQFSPDQTDNNVKSVFVDGSSAAIGDMITQAITGLESSTTYYIRIQAVNASNTGSDLSDEVSAATKANLPPVISPAEKITATLKATQKQTFEYKLSDPENDNLTESFTAGSAAASISRSGNTVTVTIDALKADEGTYNATLTVTDVAGNTATAEIAYTILPNNKPVSTTAFGKFVMNKGESTTLNLDQHFTDPDGDKLTYVVSSSDNTVTNCTVQGNTLTIYATSYGTATVGVFAKDARNATSSTSSMQILVRNTKEALDVYPTTVQTTLNIRTATDGNADILITGASGATVYAKTSVATGPFNPHTINTTEWGAGVYSVEVTIGSNKYKKTVVKL